MKHALSINPAMAGRVTRPANRPVVRRAALGSPLVVALLLGAWLANEVVGRQAVLAAVLTLAGLALILLAPEVRRSPPGRTAEFAIPEPAVAPILADAADAPGSPETRAAA